MRLVEEADALGPEARRVIEPDSAISAEELAAALAGKAGGRPQPAWASGEGGAHLGAIAICRAGPATVWPQFGAVADAHGHLFKATAGEMLASAKGLDRLTAKARMDTIERAAVFVPYGASFNYGHFLLDALPSLLALEEAVELDGREILCPPLKTWQRDLLHLGFPDRAFHQAAAAVSVREVVWADSMDHYLHRPGPIVGRLRQRLLAAAHPPRRSGRRLYVSRRGWSMRVLLNERRLEQALAARGFEIVHPESLSAAEQIALFASAEVVIGATGAALANALFMPSGARLIELLPQTYAHPWVRDLCRQAGADWRGWFEPAPLPRSDVPWRHRLRRGFRFAWQADLAAFLPWLDAAL